MKGYEKYIPFKPQPIEHRTWPDNLITHAPQLVLRGSERRQPGPH